MMICLDANCVIYLIERNPIWGPKVVARLAAARTIGDTAAMSDLARSECLIGPLKTGDAAVLGRLPAILFESDRSNITVDGGCLRAGCRGACGLCFENQTAGRLALGERHRTWMRLVLDERCGMARCSAIPVEVLT